MNKGALKQHYVVESAGHMEEVWLCQDVIIKFTLTSCVGMQDLDVTFLVASDLQPLKIKDIA